MRWELINKVFSPLFLAGYIQSNDVQHGYWLHFPINYFNFALAVEFPSSVTPGSTIELQSYTSISPSPCRLPKPITAIHVRRVPIGRLDGGTVEITYYCE